MGRSWLPVRAGIDDLEGEFLELGEQRPYLPRVVEQGLPVGGLGHGEPAGDGPAVYLAGPFGVGAVQGGRVAVASAGRLAAGVGADGEGAGQGGPGRFGELGGDLVQGRALGWACVHATHRLRSAVSRTVHSIFLWTVRAGRRMGAAETGMGGYIAAWRPVSVPPQAAAFARAVVGQAAPARRERAKNLLWAAGKLASWAAGLGLDLAPEVLLHPSVIERFTAHAPGLTGVTRRTLRTNLRHIARRSS